MCEGSVLRLGTGLALQMFSPGRSWSGKRINGFNNTQMICVIKLLISFCMYCRSEVQILVITFKAGDLHIVAMAVT